MISSILVSEKNSKDLRRLLLISAGCSVFCLVFFLVYDIFSHEVRSPYMTFLFAWPLVLCVIPCALLLLIPLLPGPSLISSLLWNTGTAAVTVSSLLRGIFEIAGNSSVYQQILMNAGRFLLLGGFIMYAAGIIIRRKAQ